MLFHAKLALRSVCDITPELLGKLGVRGLLLDIDHSRQPHAGTRCGGLGGWNAGGGDLPVPCVQQPPAESRAVCQAAGAGLRL